MFKKTCRNCKQLTLCIPYDDRDEFTFFLCPVCVTSLVDAVKVEDKIKSEQKAKSVSL